MYTADCPELGIEFEGVEDIRITLCAFQSIILFLKKSSATYPPSIIQWHELSIEFAQQRRQKAFVLVWVYISQDSVYEFNKSDMSVM